MTHQALVTTLLHGDSTTLMNAGLRTAEGKPIRCDAAITDPPYGVSLDGDRDWDTFEDSRSFTNHTDDGRKFQEFIKGYSRLLFADYLYPGAHYICFSSERTVFRAGVGIEEAQFEVIGGLAWLYATGQVKSKDRLRPAYEPIVLARKGTTKTLAAEFKQSGRGLLHTKAMAAAEGKQPTNVLADVAILEPEIYTDPLDLKTIDGAFFYVAKPSPKERDFGCESLPIRSKEGGLSGTPGISGASGLARNIHPTVKPIDLMRRLVRLVTKPGATVIDPFMGSGTTGIACVLEGRNFCGIEREAEFHEICTLRVNAAKEVVQRLGRLPAPEETFGDLLKLVKWVSA